MTVDPKWLGIRKASGWQTTGLAVALGLFLLGAHKAWIPQPPPLFLQLTALGFLVCSALTVASLASAAHTFFPIEVWLKYWIDVRRNRGQIADYIPFMTKKEKEIIGYLLERNQTTFTADMDGGYARTLLARGIVLIVVAPGQQVDPTNVPMMVPPHLWSLFQENKTHFTDGAQSGDGEGEAPPWRIPWMAR